MVTVSPFFTQNRAGTPAPLGASNGLAGSIIMGGASSTTVSGTISITGNSTAGGGWTDGNGLATGVTATYDLSFDVTGSNGTGGDLLGAGGTNGNNGVGIGGSNNQAMNVGEVLTFGTAMVSSVSFSGAPSAAGFVFSAGSLDSVGLVAFRSVNLTAGQTAQMVAGGVTTSFISGFDPEATAGFRIDDTFVDNPATDDFFPSQLLFGTGSSPVALSVTNGGMHLNGFALQTNYSYDIVAVPEPTSMAFLAVGLAGVAVRRRRRANA